MKVKAVLEFEIEIDGLENNLYLENFVKDMAMCKLENIIAKKEISSEDFQYIVEK